jgi:UDP-N-acetylglucosamine transferase subunit ALG13
VAFDEFNNLLKKADIIITHGGVGSILNAIKLGKKVIAVPRLKKYDEHINDHQLQVIEKMTKEGYILSTEDEKKLPDKIKEIANFEPKVYTSNTDNFITNFKKLLDETIK